MKSFSRLFMVTVALSATLFAQDDGPISESWGPGDWRGNGSSTVSSSPYAGWISYGNGTFSQVPQPGETIWGEDLNGDGRMEKLDTIYTSSGTTFHTQQRLNPYNQIESVAYTINETPTELIQYTAQGAFLFFYNSSTRSWQQLQDCNLVEAQNSYSNAYNRQIEVLQSGDRLAHKIAYADYTRQERIYQACQQRKHRGY